MAASLETNKVLAALLTAGILASGAGVISRILYHPSMPEENAYVIQVAETETGAGEAAEPAAVPLPVLLAQADPEKGATQAKKCAACHSEEKGGPIKIGPPLWGVVGRDVASVPGFAYSDALLGKEGAWTFEALNQFIHDPKAYAPGTKMAFAGIKKPEDLADVLVFLRTLSDEPAPLPEAPPEATAATEQAAGEGAAAPAADTATTGEQAPAGEQAAANEQAAPATATAGSSGQAAGAGQQAAAVEQGAPAGAAPAGAASGAGDGIGTLLAQADVDAGAKDARKCGACHSFEEGGAVKIGPPLWGVVGRDIASVEGFSYSDALAQKEGAWDYQTLDSFLAQPREWAPGTKMAFAGLKKPEERADVILYLRSLSDNPAPLP